MKLAYVVHANLPPYDWAHSVQIMCMCQAFSEIGIEVTLIVPNRRLPSLVDPFSYYGIPQIFTIKKVPCIDVGLFSQSVLSYWLRSLSFFISARLFLYINNFDFVYSRDIYASLFVPGVVLERHSFPKKMSLIHHLMFWFSSKIVVLTSFIKERLVAAGIPEKKVLVAADGVDIEVFKNIPTKAEARSAIGMEGNQFVFGYIGTLKTMGMEKGVADALHALAKLPDKFRFLVVGGEPEDISFYRNMAQNLGVEERAVFAGKIPHHDVPIHLAACDAVVAPFPENEHYSYFMSPLKIFEYMAGNRPIISTALPSIKEVLIDGINAILIPPGNVSALASSLEMLEKDPMLGERLAYSAYIKVVGKYTWKRRAENILNFIKINKN